MRKEYKQPLSSVIDMQCQYGYLQDFGMSPGTEGNPPEIMSKKHSGFSFDDFEEDEEGGSVDNRKYSLGE